MANRVKANSIVDSAVEICGKSRKANLNTNERTQSDAVDIYYGIEFFRLEGQISTLCNEVDQRMVSRSNIERNETYILSLRSNLEDDIVEYADIGYKSINDNLRSEEKQSVRDVIPIGDQLSISGLIEAIDGAPNNNRDFFTFRHTFDFEFDNGRKFSNFEVGDTFYDQGFFSVSWRPSHVMTERGGYILIIRIPKRMKVIFIELLGKLGEAEVLTYPGPELKITDIYSKRIYNFTLRSYDVVKIYILEIIGNYWNDKWSP
uniref:ADP-ribosyltransferase exoenzyme n=1 Tax=Pithovirus LCPAC404 TaxID=2506597 RepID=A0A481ZH06_9VIRU|nr:MAG: ADP-ribosyltransferase exoenzyme [Pithovirus LCPAC404]